jgi:hypothetical protein
MTQYLDVASVEHTCQATAQQHLPNSYYAEVPATPIDEQSRQVSQLIDLAFDMLGVYHLDVRVIGADASLA